MWRRHAVPARSTRNCLQSLYLWAAAGMRCHAATCCDLVTQVCASLAPPLTIHGGVHRFAVVFISQGHLLPWHSCLVLSHLQCAASCDKRRRCGGCCRTLCCGSESSACYRRWRDSYTKRASRLWPQLITLLTVLYATGATFTLWLLKKARSTKTQVVMVACTAAPTFACNGCAVLTAAHAAMVADVGVIAFASALAHVLSPLAMSWFGHWLCRGCAACTAAPRALLARL